MNIIPLKSKTVFGGDKRLFRGLQDGEAGNLNDG